MVHAAIVIHDAADVDCRKVSTLLTHRDSTNKDCVTQVSTIVKSSTRLCLQLILNILLMLVRRRECNKLIFSTLTKIGTVIKFVL